MKPWWESLNARERLLVTGGALLSLALLIYALLWQPMQANHRRLRESVATQRAELEAMRHMAEEVQQLGGTKTNPTPPDGRSLLTVVDQTARAAGLGAALKRVTPQGDDRIGVQFDGVGFDALAPWLGTLERDHRIVITTLSVERGAATGLVNARLIVQGAPP